MLREYDEFRGARARPAYDGDDGRGEYYNYYAYKKKEKTAITFLDVVVKTFAVVLGIWLTFYIAKCAAHVFQGYRLQYIKKYDKQSLDVICDGHPELQRLLPDKCNEAKMLAEASPLWGTFLSVSGKVFTCGTVPCTEAFSNFIGTLSSHLFFISLAAVPILIAYVLIARVAAPLAVSAVRPAHVVDDHHSPARLHALERQTYARVRAPMINEVEY